MIESLLKPVAFLGFSIFLSTVAVALGKKFNYASQETFIIFTMQLA